MQQLRFSTFGLQPIRCPCQQLHTHIHTPARPQRRSSGSCRATHGDERLPVVDNPTVLPPPPTGSQYAWRNSWRGRASNGNGGGGGTGGRSQARTRDWGRGPGSGLLFELIYRIRLMLLYGLWVTVLYGAVQATWGLAHRVVGGVKGFASKFPGAATSISSCVRGGSSSTSRSMDGGSSSGNSSSSAAAAADMASSTAADAAEPASPLEGLAGSVAVADGAASISGAAADAASISGVEFSCASVGPPASRPAAHQRSSSSSNRGSTVLGTSPEQRPTAMLFNSIMTCVVPLYLILVGSVVFFASM